LRHFAAGDANGGGKGERAYKIVTVKTFTPENKVRFTKHFRARPGFCFTAADVDKILDSVADQIEQRFPGHNYEMVEVGDGCFNFVWRGQSRAPAGQEAATS